MSTILNTYPDGRSDVETRKFTKTRRCVRRVSLFDQFRSRDYDSAAKGPGLSETLSSVRFFARKNGSRWLVTLCNYAGLLSGNIISGLSFSAAEAPADYWVRGVALYVLRIAFSLSYD